MTSGQLLTTVLYELNPPSTQNIEDGMKMAMQNHGSCSRCKFGWMEKKEKEKTKENNSRRGLTAQESGVDGDVPEIVLPAIIW